jgi:hypothetical protein
MARTRRPGGRPSGRRSRAATPRRRDYKAEYRQRQASAARKLGKLPGELTREEKERARGHANEKAERQRRERRSMQKYGASTARLRRLRRAALAHMQTELASRGISVERARQNLANFTAEMLEIILTLKTEEIRSRAGMSYDALIEEYPEAANDERRNPFWYN